MANQESLIIKDSGGTEADVTAANALKVDGSAVTQPVSGTVTVTPSGTQNVDVVGNTIGLATQATLATIDADTSALAGTVAGSEIQVDVVAALPTGTNTIGSVKITDGTDVADIVPLGTQVVTGDKGIVVNSVLHGWDGSQFRDIQATSGGKLITEGSITNATLPLPTGASTEATLLSVKTAVETIDNAISGSEMQVDVITMPTVTVTATNLDIRDLTFAADKVDASGTVLGTGTNNIGDVDIASIAAGTNYIGKVRPTDGITDGEIVPLAGYNAQAVAIVDGAGAQITSFGGGVQYTEGDVDASVTGTAVMWEDAADTMRVASASKPLPVALITNINEGVVSTVNSSAVALGAGAVFTGTSEDVSHYASITVTIATNRVSTVNGISFQQSSNAVNWDYVDLYTHDGVNPMTFNIRPSAQYFRVVYTNGGLIQTYFRLQTIYHIYANPVQVARPSDVRSNEFSPQEVSAFGSVYNGTTWSRMRGDTTNGVDVDVTRMPAITKGTQGTTGTAVQRLNDAGRNARHFMLDAYTAAPLVEAVQSVVQWFSSAAVAGTTQPAVVTAGKTLRLTNYTISTKSLNTVGSAVVRIRANTAGLGVLASPLVFSMECGSGAGATTVAMTGGMSVFNGVFPEGLEFAAGTGLAFSMAGYGPTGTLTLQGVTRFAVYGYEY